MGDLIGERCLLLGCVGSYWGVVALIGKWWLFMYVDVLAHKAGFDGSSSWIQWLLQVILWLI